MDVKLSNGKTFTLKALTLAQVRRMSSTVDAGRGMEATVQACSDSSLIPVAELEEALSLPEANELFARVMEVSGLNVGEPEAAASTSMNSSAASLPTVQ